MKKSLFLLSALFVSVLCSAQEKNDFYISLSTSLETGMGTLSATEGSYSSSANLDLDTSFNLSSEFGYFVADNVKIGLAWGGSITSTPSTDEDNITMTSSVSTK